MSDQENPLSRWARLKQAAKTEEIDAVSADSEATAVPGEAFDPASLPSIESIVGDTDILAFLRKGVPAALTQAALRRAWASDPAIRDFIGIAENQWDFNDPDGIPGFGPLLASDDAPAVPALVSSQRERIAEALGELPISIEQDQPRAADPEPTLDESCCTGSGISDSPAKASEVEAGAKEDGAVEQDETSGNRRQHGGALPR